MRLALSLTLRCNAQCAHCTPACGPHRNESLSTGTLIRLIHQAAQIRDEVPFEVALTGGEPFLDVERLIRLVAFASGLGARVSCVSNASWASNDARAHALTQQLAHAGLGMLGISISRYHLQFVPATRIRRALLAAREAGIATVLKAALTTADFGSDTGHDITACAELADQRELFAVLAPGRTPDALDQSTLLRLHELPDGVCPGQTLTIGTDGKAWACGSSGTMSPLLQVGHIDDSSIANLQQRLRQAPRFKLLRDLGPRALLDPLPEDIRHEIGQRRHADVCDLCTHIGSACSQIHLREHTAEAMVPSS